MYQDHTAFQQPPDAEAKIWRYLDFTKFGSMLETRSLYFTRADCFRDKFEGAWAKPNVERWRAAVLEAAKRDQAPDGGLPPHLAAILAQSADMRRRVAVNCWHVNEYESEAMWKVYLKTNEGIAVRSTVRRLRDSLSTDPGLLVFVGMVAYLDYDTEPLPSGNCFFPFLHKRRSFEHERELRALAIRSALSDPEAEPFWTGEDFESNGVLVHVDLGILVERVYVAPTSDPWFEDLVRSVVGRYELGKQVKRSTLEDDPLY